MRRTLFVVVVLTRSQGWQDEYKTTDKRKANHVASDLRKLGTYPQVHVKTVNA